MNIIIKTWRRTTWTGTVVSGCCEYSYNLKAKIKNLTKQQAENVRNAITQALKGTRNEE